MNNKIDAKLVLNIEIKDPDLVSELTTISMELALSIDEFIICSIEKMIYDISFVRNMRKANNS